MKALLTVTKQFFVQIWSDAMLAVLLFIPIIMGLVFRLGVPLLENYLCVQLARTTLITPWYPLFDLLLALMTPIMFTAAGAMVILDEADLGLARAIAVTPVGRTGYLASRIIIPALLATIYCAGAVLLFKISNLTTVRLLWLAACSGALGAVTALMIATVAQNKVEGLACSKLSGLFVLGLPAAVLLPAPLKYIFGVLPTFWMTELALGGSLLYVIPSLAVSFLWIVFFIRHFQRRILT